MSKIEEQHFLSSPAIRRLRIESQKTGYSVSQTFRYYADRLANDANPKWSVSGESLDYVRTFAIEYDTLRSLQRICDDLGVSRDCLGELVCSYIPRELREARPINSIPRVCALLTKDGAQ
ncbi:UNVERIFIED_ORG: hypothetical protein BDU10_3472 [Burkholderia sp. CF145]